MASTMVGDAARSDWALTAVGLLQAVGTVRAVDHVLDLGHAGLPVLGRNGHGVLARPEPPLHRDVWWPGRRRWVVGAEAVALEVLGPAPDARRLLVLPPPHVAEALGRGGVGDDLEGVVVLAAL